MIEIFKTINNEIKKIKKPEPGCWINVENPNLIDKEYLKNQINIYDEFLKSAFDKDEVSHFDYDDDTDQRLIIIDYPIKEQDDDKGHIEGKFTTEPVSIIFLKDMIVTISLFPNLDINDIKNNRIKGINTQFKTKMFLQLTLKISQRYLVYLKQIDKLSLSTEKKLYMSQKNGDLIDMLALEKSLVYFSTSLKTGEGTIRKIMRGRLIKLYDEDQDLLDDVLLEMTQAIEMASIYTNILSGTMDTFASIISNNLNIVMKVLTVITIVLSIPNIIFSFYGMNVKDNDLPFNYWWVPIIISSLLCIITTIYFKTKKRFK